jgi:hypothetical protein
MVYTYPKTFKIPEKKEGKLNLNKFFNDRKSIDPSYLFARIHLAFEKMP